MSDASEKEAVEVSNHRQFEEEKGGTDRDAAAAVKRSNDRQFAEERKETDGSEEG